MYEEHCCFSHFGARDLSHGVPDLNSAEYVGTEFVENLTFGRGTKLKFCLKSGEQFEIQLFPSMEV